MRLIFYLLLVILLYSCREATSRLEQTLQLAGDNKLELQKVLDHYASDSLTAAGVAAQMMPVPRRLSAACGTCVRYTADSPMLSCMDTDYEAVYETADNTTPRLLCENR